MKMTLKEICKSIEAFNNIQNYLSNERMFYDAHKLKAHFVFTIRERNLNDISDFFIDDIDSNFESNANFIERVFKEFNISNEIAKYATTKMKYTFDGGMYFVGDYFVEQHGENVPRKLYAQVFYDYE